MLPCEALAGAGSAPLRGRAPGLAARLLVVLALTACSDRVIRFCDPEPGATAGACPVAGTGGGASIGGTGGSSGNGGASVTAGAGGVSGGAGTGGAAGSGGVPAGGAGGASEVDASAPVLDAGDDAGEDAAP